MRKNISIEILIISLILLSFMIFRISVSTVVLAQTQEEPTPTETETPLQMEATPSSTTGLPSIDVKKGYNIIKDVNANGSIDPGDKIAYTITISNNSSTDATNLIIRDNLPNKYFEIFKNGDITKNGINNGQFIEWKLDVIPAGSTDSVGYDVTLIDPFEFGTTEISNPVTVFSNGVLLAETKSTFTVRVLTPTQSPTSSPTVAPTPYTATPTTPSPGASTLSSSPLPTLYVVIMFILGIGVFTYVGSIAKFTSSENSKTNDEFNGARVAIFREGVIIIFIVSAVLLMGISNILQPDGVISILSAIVGYVFGRATTRV